MNHKVKQGYQLWVDLKVEIIHYDEELVQGTVQGTEEYNVSYLGGYYRCDCPDWTYRWDKNEGGYMCKHLEAFRFEMMSYMLMRNII
ncbi:MAG: SWIM zinc finger family protein [Candidatus Thermoplasmatota archaeon]|nr:SWIM zinc finger family protein [Candidatus Thermoplasmatota archaeon]